MKNNKLTITISGKHMSGKSTMAFLIKNFLRENGFDIDLKLLDFKSENDFNVKMIKKIEHNKKALANSTLIQINEEQLPNDFKTV